RDVRLHRAKITQEQRKERSRGKYKPGIRAVCEEGKESPRSQKLDQAPVQVTNEPLISQEAALRRIQTDCYNNLAACLLRMEPVNYERVKEYSLKVLEQQPRNAKALYRAGVAAYHLRDYEQAQRCLAQAALLQPRDAGVKRYLELAESQLSAHRQKEKQLYASMFG
uniref:Tetratricopeptide repeat domain 9C n=1 Tax=Dromaius novaehollandiae TaxID=8790 RepID=A0A8C4JCQ1_DRONO